MIRRPQSSTFFPYTPLFRSLRAEEHVGLLLVRGEPQMSEVARAHRARDPQLLFHPLPAHRAHIRATRENVPRGNREEREDRKSTRLNSSHSQISYAVFCLKK